MILSIVILVLVGLALSYTLTHRNRYYLEKHAERLGIKPGKFETDEHLRERIFKFYDDKKNKRRDYSYYNELY